MVGKGLWSGGQEVNAILRGTLYSVWIFRMDICSYVLLRLRWFRDPGRTSSPLGSHLSGFCLISCF